MIRFTTIVDLPFMPVKSADEPHGKECLTVRLLLASHLIATAAARASDQIVPDRVSWHWEAGATWAAGRADRACCH